jgi:FkbH-like protein
MINLKICGSSFLLPKNRAWKSLEEKFNLNYAEYGDISGALFHTDHEDAVLLVLFYEDILPNSQVNYDSLSERFESLFNSISFRCINSNKPTIICWGKVFNTNPIKQAKRITEEIKANNWFVEQFQKLSKNFNSLYFVNLNQIYSDKGYENVFDDRNWYFAHCRVSSLGISLLSNSVNYIFTRHFKTASKVLVLDCDNTLWGGVIGEDGIEGILLGQDGVGKAFVDFQSEIKKLSDEGVLIALASKNNEEEVWNVFNNHPEMILKKSDIVSWRINWSEKSESIKSIAEELDLSIDSLVFWDDNPLERSKIKNILREVCLVEIPDDVFKWPRLLRNLEYFSKFEVTNEDLNKTYQYHGRAKFVRDSSKIADIFDYLKSINLNPIATNLNNTLLARAAQLCLKTNQYNLRTVRHSAEELVKIQLFNNDFCFLVSLSDNYGDHGVVALVCLKKLDNEILFIDTFLMSCRVLGRYLESWILKEIVNRAVQYNFQYLIGEFIATERNIVAKDFFNTYGFTRVEKNSECFIKVKNSKLTCNGDIFMLTLKDSLIPYLDIYENN